MLINIEEVLKLINREIEQIEAETGGNPMSKGAIQVDGLNKVKSTIHKEFVTNLEYKELYTKLVDTVGNIDCGDCPFNDYCTTSLSSSLNESLCGGVTTKLWNMFKKTNKRRLGT